MKTTTTPSLKTMERWMMDGVAAATDGCRVELDGECWHGAQSWLIVLGQHPESVVWRNVRNMQMGRSSDYISPAIARIAKWWPTINAMRATDGEKATLLAQVADGQSEALFVVRALARHRDI